MPLLLRSADQPLSFLSEGEERAGRKEGTSCQEVTEGTSRRQTEGTSRQGHERKKEAGGSEGGGGGGGGEGANG